MEFLTIDLNFRHFSTTMASTSSSKSDHEKHVNRLAKEKSPYLLQHASNPVNWYPWCDEALALAKKENKLIFLSIGYRYFSITVSVSLCHLLIDVNIPKKFVSLVPCDGT